MLATLPLKSFLIDVQEKNEHTHKVSFVIGETGLEDCATQTQGKIHGTWQHLKRIRQRKQASSPNTSTNDFGSLQTSFFATWSCRKEPRGILDSLVLF